MLAYDVIGFQTWTDRDNFAPLPAIRARRGRARRRLDGGRRPAVRADVFPIGIDAERFAELRQDDRSARPPAQIRSRLHDRKLIIGVDRLDYSKGIPERFRAFGRLLKEIRTAAARSASCRSRRCRARRSSAYAALRRELEELAGNINGTYGQLDWTPIQIMTRGFSRKGLAGLFRASHVGAGHAASRRHEPRRQGICRGAGSRGSGRARPVALRRRGRRAARGADRQSARHRRGGGEAPAGARDAARGAQGALAGAERDRAQGERPALGDRFPRRARRLARRVDRRRPRAAAPRGGDRAASRRVRRSAATLLALG